MSQQWKPRRSLKNQIRKLKTYQIQMKFCKQKSMQSEGHGCIKLF